MASRWARVVRGLLAASVATLVAALFHMAGGGVAPSALALTLSLVFSALACIALAGRGLALWRLTLSVALSQFLFHTLFALSPSGSFAGADPSGHVHLGSHLVMVSSGGATSMAPMAPESAAMWVSHGFAALVTIAALRFGETSFWALCEFTAFQLQRLFGSDLILAPETVPAARVGVLSLPEHALQLAVVLGEMRHRGPPAGHASFA